ncbi:MAG: JDVT-CTERM system glutamic-type intramembrane protease [Caldimonas sp.]
MSAAFAAALLVAPLLWLLRATWAMPHAVLAPQPVAVALALLIYPCLEEFIFRGALQPALARALARRASRAPGGFSAANALTSLAFAALHLLRQADPAALLTFFPSLVFGWFRDRHGTLWRSIVLHAWYNVGAFIG